MNIPTPDIQAAVDLAMRIGPTAAERKTKIHRDTIRSHLRKRGLKAPRSQRINKTYDLELAVLARMFAGRPLSTYFIAHVCNVTPERIRQIEKDALRKIRTILIERHGFTAAIDGIHETLP